MNAQKSIVLIVDDREANLLSLDALLSNDERILLWAHSGREALEVITKHKVDLILLDVQMPDMNGFEVARAVRARKESANVPILFASAERLDQASRLQGFSQGAIDYLLKPLDPDITRAKVKVLLELHQQKRELVRQNELLERSALLINASADILGVVDARSLIIEEMNPAFTRMLGFTESEYINRALADFLDPEHRYLLDPYAEGAGEHLAFQALVHGKNGQSRWVDWKVVKRNGKGYVNGRDVTEIRDLHASLQRNVQQLEAANKELEAFSYSVSHDLRAPLRAVHGNAVILEEDFADKLQADGIRYLKKVQNNARRMDTLINELLAFSRLGKKPLSKAAVDMNALVREVVDDLFQSQPHKAHLDIGVLPEAYGDLSMLRQVWTNLISNALKYSSRKSHPRVSIAAAESRGEVEYCVADNGAGFDMQYADKLFGTFQRLHDASEFEGTGIGLAIVQRIILKHGGTIRAEGKPDEGATFTFRIPPK